MAVHKNKFADLLNVSTKRVLLFFSSQSQRYMKGQCHEIDLLLKGLNIFISTYFLVCAEGFQGLPKYFHYSIKVFTFYSFFEITY